MRGLPEELSKFFLVFTNLVKDCDDMEIISVPEKSYKDRGSKEFRQFYRVAMK